MPSNRLRVFYFALIPLLVLLLAACGAPHPDHSASDAIGTLNLALSSTTHDRTYRLRAASFGISGPTNVVIDSESDPNSDVLSASLETGSYSVQLAGGWFLERLAPEGPVRVPATLVSANPTDFTITSGTTTSVVYRLETEGLTVTLGTGNLALSVAVTETAPGLSLLAGRLGGSGSGDGLAQSARFYFPQAIVVADARTLYVADGGNRTIRKVLIATGEATTIAGSANSPDDYTIVDGVGAAARFSFPRGLALDPAGNLYVSDANTIRKVVLDTGEVTTLAGTQGGYGSVDGVGAAAQFSQPQGLASDRSGNLYVADGTTIRKVVLATGEVTTLAGVSNDFRSVDGIGVDARFGFLSDLTSDGQGNLFISDAGGRIVRQMVLATAEVTTLAGNLETSNLVDGVGREAGFANPTAITSDGAGNVFVYDNAVLRHIVVATGRVTSFAGFPFRPGTQDGIGIEARFSLFAALTNDGVGNLYVADSGNHTIRKVDIDGAVVTTLSGAAPQVDARSSPSTDLRGLDSDASGTLYVMDAAQHTLKSVARATGRVTTLAGFPFNFGSADGVGGFASFNTPLDVVRDAAGDLFVADTTNVVIRRVVPQTGSVTTFAGARGQFGNIDGVGDQARFASPTALESDGEGNLYVGDRFTGAIRKIVIATREVSTLIANDGRFSSVQGLASDHAGHLFVTDSNHDGVSQITLATGDVTVLAGSGVRGFADGGPSAAAFNMPGDISFDGSGHLYVVDVGNHAVRKIELATGNVRTVVGAPGEGSGVLLGALPARLNAPTAIKALPDGTLAIIDEQALLLARF